MARRSREWNEGLSLDLRDQEFAREFLMAAIDEGVPIQEALGKVIRAYGVAEFAKRVKMASPNVLRAVDRRHNPTLATLNALLKPFKLKLAVTPIDSPKRQRKAS
jgi:DNA-binding phage protein